MINRTCKQIYDIFFLTHLTRVCEWMRSSWRINSMQLTRNSIACRLWMPQWFSANSDTKTGHTDLTHINDYWSVSALRRMMSCARWMSRMRLMRIVNIVMRTVQIVMGIMDIMMGTMNSMMGVMDRGMGIMARDKGIGKTKGVRVSLITISHCRTTTSRHVITWRPTLRGR